MIFVNIVYGISKTCHLSVIQGSIKIDVYKKSHVSLSFLRIRVKLDIFGPSSLLLESTLGSYFLDILSLLISLTYVKLTTIYDTIKGFWHFYLLLRILFRSMNPCLLHRTFSHCPLPWFKIVCIWYMVNESEFTCSNHKCYWNLK